VERKSRLGYMHGMLRCDFEVYSLFRPNGRRNKFIVVWQVVIQASSRSSNVISREYKQ